MYTNLVCVSVALFALTGSAFADPSKCYSCDGTLYAPCNDPISNTSALPICQVASETGFETTLLQKLNLKQDLAPVTDKTGTTCAKIVVTQDGKNYAARLCAYKKIDGKDTCKYLKDNAGDVKFTCNTCSSDLCNSASTVTISLLSFLGMFVVLLALK